jgi:hypothetical protein
VKTAADPDACADTGIALSWQPAASWGSGASGTYSVYRDTVPNFTPSSTNRIAAGLVVTSYTDVAAPNGATLYYLVRAENNEGCSTGPNNRGVEDDNTVYLSVTDRISVPAPADLGSSVMLALVADTHVRLTWPAAANAASYRVYRADQPGMAGATVIGTTAGIFYDDVGEATTSTNRFYRVKGVNACGVEGP